MLKLQTNIVGLFIKTCLNCSRFFTNLKIFFTSDFEHSGFELAARDFYFMVIFLKSRSDVCTTHLFLVKTPLLFPNMMNTLSSEWPKKKRRKKKKHFIYLSYSNSFAASPGQLITPYQQPTIWYWEIYV